MESRVSANESQSTLALTEWRSTAYQLAAVLGDFETKVKFNSTVKNSNIYCYKSDQQYLCGNTRRMVERIDSYSSEEV